MNSAAAQAVPSSDLTSVQFTPAPVPAGLPPTLFVIVDTEEEFDWRAPFARENTSVTAMRKIGRFQSVVEKRGIRPTYVIDYPVAHQKDGYQPLKEFADEGRCVIGAHLHPWVTPPLVEPLIHRNSFGCCLGEEVERDKIRTLRDEIAERFGAPPLVFKAGRYGFGPTTAQTLEALGFTIDLSVNPRMDFSDEGGPSFAAFDTRPLLFGRSRRLLEVPCSTDYTGLCGRASQPVHNLISHPALVTARVPGILARLGIVNKVMLSPENSTLDEMKSLTRTLLKQGVRTFSLTLHSPSVEPGCTPYVRTRTQLDAFLASIADYCDFFLGDIGGVSSTPSDFLTRVISVDSVDMRAHS